MRLPVNFKKLGIIAFGIWLLLIFSLYASEPEPFDPLPDDITTLTLEQLMEIDVDVTTISKIKRNIQDMPSSVYVITSEDIKRSGAAKISDLLALVPGYTVSQNSSQAFQSSNNNYGKYSRGFHGPISANMLILIDGRSILSQATSVNWSQYDVVLEDVERLEIIRGAASALWGSDAVNGVVNIITKKTKDTKGVLVSAGKEIDAAGSGVVRYGGRITDTCSYRIFSKYFEDHFETCIPDGNSNFSCNVTRAGFRIDHDLNEKNSYLYMGEAYSSDFYLKSFQDGFVSSLGKYDIETETFGGNFHFRFLHTISKNSDIKLQVSYDRVDTDFLTTKIERQETSNVDIGYGFTEEIINIDFQHAYRWNEREGIVWGIEARFMYDNFEGTYYMWTTPSSKRTERFSAFLEADVALIDELVFLSIGSNVEYNDYTDYEIQPSMQILLQPAKKHTVWFSAAKSVRTPTRLESDMYLGVVSNRTETHLSVYRFYGNPDISSEDIISFEAGYRFHLNKSIFLDFSLYCNEYDHVIYFEAGDQRTGYNVEEGKIEIEWPFNMENLIEARSSGGEIAIDWQIKKWLKLKAHYAYLSFELDLSKIDDWIVYGFNLSEDNPKNEISFHSWVDITDTIELNTRIRYFDDQPRDSHESSFVLDSQIRWKISNRLDLFILGKNLTGSTSEFISKDYFQAPDIRERSIYAKIEWRYE